MFHLVFISALNIDHSFHTIAILIISGVRNLKEPQYSFTQLHPHVLHNPHIRHLKLLHPEYTTSRHRNFHLSIKSFAQKKISRDLFLAGNLQIFTIVMFPRNKCCFKRPY